MAVKYVTPTQTLEVTYEGQRRRFSLCHVSTQNHAASGHIEDLAADLETLSLRTRAQLWIVGWDTEISLVDAARTDPDPTSAIRVRETCRL